MATELKLGGKTYVILPKADYLKLRKGETPPKTVDAVEYARASIGADLRAARENAGLSQNDLAEKLGKSQTLVARAEAGAVSVGEKYIASVLKACGLPKKWKRQRTSAGDVGAAVATAKARRSRERSAP
jgi:ribosome-binding protein aMBF1 (putative translation factor)